LIVTIDGPAGAGKSTVARQLAAQLGYRYLNSGATYRAVAWAVLAAGFPPEQTATVGRLAEMLTLDVIPSPDRFRVLVDGRRLSERLADPDVAAASSKVAANPRVRTRLVARQRELCRRGDWVVEGRDMGTAVFPESPCKIYLTADPAVRAERRAREGSAETAAALAERDARDAGRAVDPLRPADDAVVIDTTHLAIAAVVQQCAELVARARDGAARPERT